MYLLHSNVNYPIGRDNKRRDWGGNGLEEPERSGTHFGLWTLF